MLDEKFISSIVLMLNSCESPIEVELHCGMNKNSTLQVTERFFEFLFKYLENLCGEYVTNHSIITNYNISPNKTIRLIKNVNKIADLKEKEICQEKTKLSHEAYTVTGLINFKLVKSLESQKDKEDERISNVINKFPVENLLIRNKKTFKFKHNSIPWASFELSKVEDARGLHHEFEIEFDLAKKYEKNDLFFLNIFCVDFIGYHNKLNGKNKHEVGTKPVKMINYYLVSNLHKILYAKKHHIKQRNVFTHPKLKKPKTLLLDDKQRIFKKNCDRIRPNLFFGSFKLDGNRVLVLVNRKQKKIFVFDELIYYEEVSGKHEAKMVWEDVQWGIFLFEAELLGDEIIIFDVMVGNNMYIYESDFIQRQKIIYPWKNKFHVQPHYEVNSNNKFIFQFWDSYLKNQKEHLKNFDGVIISLGETQKVVTSQRSRFHDFYRYKQKDQITVDFYVDNRGCLMLYDRDKNDLFLDTSLDKYRILSKAFRRKIVECSYNTTEDEFIPRRIRDDKTSPNHKVVFFDIWNRIHGTDFSLG